MLRIPLQERREPRPRNYANGASCGVARLHRWRPRHRTSAASSRSRSRLAPLLQAAHAGTAPSATHAGCPPV